MRILMVTPYPPIRDGIANYAVQEVKRLRGEGHDVEVLSAEPSAAHHHLELTSRRGPLALAKRTRAYDRVIVQYHPDMFFPIRSTRRRSLEITLGLLVAFRAAPEVEVRVHEVNYDGGRGRSPLATATRALWRSVDRVSVHTDGERRLFAESFGVPLGRIDVLHHGESFQRRAHATREEARDRLGLPRDDFVFLSIGFVQPHKGFDRAVRAFARLGPIDDGAPRRLDVVGSVRVEEPEYVAYLEDLRDLVGSTPGTALHEGYVGDETFDLWIIAADAIVLPYRYIWSSSVVERANLYERLVIATRVGGLAAQAAPGTLLVDDDDELVAAMASLIAPPGGARAPAPAAPWPEGGRDAVQAEIRARAAAQRGYAVAGGSVSMGDGRQQHGAGALGASARLRRVPLLEIPAPRSARPGAAMVKRLVRRLTAWEVDPVVHQVNRLHEALVQTVESLPSDCDRDDARDS